MYKREFLWDEVLEHTSDCDCNRGRHFKEYEKYSMLSKWFKLGQIGCLILSIITYMWYFSSEGINQDIVKAIPLVLSVVATVIEILSLAYKFDDLANKHWIAGQAYQRLYRECQFFYRASLNDDNFQTLVEKAKYISSQLNELNLMSPDLSAKSYHKIASNLENKSYPIHSVLRNEKVDSINYIIDYIKEKFKEYSIEIYIYGSYLDKLSAEDVDIAIFVHDKSQEEIEKNKLQDIVTEIELFYRKNIILDITVITDEDLRLRRFSPLIKNIILGELYYKSPSVKKCISEVEVGMSDYDSMIKYFYEKVKKATDYNETINALYYFLYHTISKQLDNNSIRWISDVSLRDNYIKFAEKNNQYEDIALKFNKIFKLYQNVNVDYGPERNKDIDSIKDLELIDKIYKEIIEEKELVNN